MEKRYTAAGAAEQQGERLQTAGHGRARGVLRTGLWAMGLSVASLSATAAPQAPTATELMDWAQARLSTVFPGTMPDVAGAGFVFRGPYATGHFMGVAGSTVYVMGPATGGQLLPLGTLENLACTVKPASCAPSDAQTLVTGYLARLKAAYAGEITGAVLKPLSDACYLNNGLTRDADTARIDSDASTRATLNRRHGADVRNAEVLAERFMINSDGSDRRELDVRYQLAYADGIVQQVTERLVQGSTAGTRTPLGACATPQVSQELRRLGNQRIVGVSVTPVNFLLERYRLADGVAQTNAPRQYRQEIRFNVTDPGNHATYATISGPGINGTYKLVSPRLLRSAPEFAGKVGNFVDWEDTDTFKACRNSGDANYADAAVADCTTNGAASNVWRANSTDPATADSTFASYGFVAGGSYTINVYNDDGWKTVNGQAGKTPVTTYTTQLVRLPASAGALATGNSAAYPAATLSHTPVQIATLLRNKAQGSIQVAETRKAKVDNNNLAFTTAYLFSQGRTAQSTTNNVYPGSRFTVNAVPTIGATSVAIEVPAVTGAMTTPNYGEVGITYEDMTGLSVRQLWTFE